MHFDNASAALVPRKCLIRLHAVYDSLKRAERNAVDAILCDPRAVAGAGIGGLSRSAGCSQATLVRLARRLGYEGFGDMKKAFAAMDANALTTQYRGIGRSDPVDMVMKKVFEAACVALRDTSATIDSVMYRRSVEAIIGAKSIVFCGLGDASVVAAGAYHRFLRLNSGCRFAEDHDLQLIMCSQMTRGDALVAISHTGRSRPVIAAVKAARRRGAETIALTNFPYSPLAKAAGIVLLTAVFTATPDGEVMSKRIAQLCVIESLYVNCLLRMGSATRHALGRADEIVKSNKSPIPIRRIRGKRPAGGDAPSKNHVRVEKTSSNYSQGRS